MLFISHDLAVVRTLADRVGVLFRGQLMEVGDVEDIFKPPFHPYTYELLDGGAQHPSLHASDALQPSRRKRVRPARPAASSPAAAQWQFGRICEEQSPPWREVTAAASHPVPHFACRSLLQTRQRAQTSDI